MSAPTAATQFICGPGFVEDEILAWLSNEGSLEGAEVLRLRETYFDTPAEEIFKAGLSARLSTDTGRPTVIIEPILIDRDLTWAPPPIRLALADDEPPGQALARVFAAEFGVHLASTPTELLTLVTTRRRHTLRHDDARFELTIDTLEATGAAAQRSAFVHLQLKLLDGAGHALARLSEALCEREGLSRSKQTAFERARAGLGFSTIRWPKKPAPLPADARLGAAVRSLVANLWASTGAHESGARVGLDPEHVHRMRVALRRLRTALRVFSEVLPADAAKGWRRELRWLGRLLGNVRDLDVHREASVQWRERLPEVTPSAWSQLDECIEQRRRQAQADLRAGLDSDRRRALDDGFARCVEAGPEETDETVAAATPRLVRVELEHCRQGLRRLNRRVTLARAHALRIHVKHLRYTLEFLRAVDRHEFRAQARACARLQTNLGALQDAGQAGAMAAALYAESPKPDSSLAYATGILVGNGRAFATLAPALVARALAESKFAARLVRLRNHVEAG